MKAYMGLDVGKKNTSVIIIDNDYNVLYKKTIITKNPINDIKYLFKDIKHKIHSYQIYNIGVTGDNRFIIGKFLGTKTIVNEIESIYNYAQKMKIEGSLLDISSNHSKIIKIKHDELNDYKIYNSSNMINVDFLNKIISLLNLNIEKIKIVKDNIIFQNDNLLLLYDEIKVLMNNGVDKNKIISSLIKKMFHDLPQFDYLLGELSINKEILNYLNKEYHLENYYSHSLGASFIAKESKIDKTFDLNIENNTIERNISKCHKCSMECEIVSIYRNHELIDSFGNNCERGKIIEFSYTKI